MKRTTLMIVGFAAIWSAAYAGAPAQNKTTAPRREASPTGQLVSATTATHESLRITDGPYLQAPSETGITIAWRTNNKCVSRVEYGTGGALQSAAFNSHHGLRDAYTTLHAVCVSGLKPGTNYQYRVISREILEFKPYKVTFGEEVRSADSQFTTLDRRKPECTFVVLNDRHEKVEPLNASLGAVRWDSVDLVFLNGDMLSDSGDEKQVYTAVVDPCVSAFAKTIPFLYVRGNHETRGNMARELLNYFPTPNGKFFYSFTQGPVHFVVMDSGEDKPDSNPAYSGLVDFDRYRDLETDWLKNEIQSKEFRKAPFRVAFIHMPLLASDSTNDEKHGIEDMRKKWGPLLNRGKVDLLVSAHTHRYARIAPEKGAHVYPIVIGGTDTTIRAAATANGLRLTVTDADGRVRDEFTVPRAPGFWGKLFGRK